MLGRIAKAGIIALAVFVSSKANAFFDPPYITPDHPGVNNILTVNIRGGVCDALIESPEFPRITRVGNQIRIVYFSSHDDDPEFCNIDIGTAHLPIGTYAAGTYEFTIARLYVGPLGQVEETLGVIPVEVVGGAPNAVAADTLGSAAIFLLFLGLGIIGLVASRRPAVVLSALVCLSLLSARTTDAQEHQERTYRVVEVNRPGIPGGCLV